MLNKRELLKASGLVLVLVFMMLWLSGAFLPKVSPGRTEVSKPKLQDPQKIAIVEEVTYPLQVEQVGTLRTMADTWVSSKIMAQVKEILVPEGSVVYGQDSPNPTIIARLDDREIRARVKQAESQLQSARKAYEMAKYQLLVAKANMESARAQRDRLLADYNRYQNLYKNQAVTAQQLEHMKSQYISAESNYIASLNQVKTAESELLKTQAQIEQAEASLKEAEAVLSYTVITAPFTGKLVKKAVEVGSMVTPGQPLFYIETHTKPELHALVAESLIPYIKVGQELEVRIDAINRSFKGVIREIVPQSDPSTRTVVVKISLPGDPSIVNGLFGRFNISYGSYTTLVVPKEAVQSIGQIRLVHVVNPDGTLSRRFVRVGKIRDGNIEILTGLKANERVFLP